MWDNLMTLLLLAALLTITVLYLWRPTAARRQPQAVLARRVPQQRNKLREE